MKLIAAADTNVGRIREINEDSVLVKVRAPETGPPAALLVVADGMGGHMAGEVASALAIQTIEERIGHMIEGESDDDTLGFNQPDDFEADPDADPQDILKARLRTAIEEANRVIFDYSVDHADEAGNLGTTVTAVLIQGDTAIIANVGDSRTYHLIDDQLFQITEDHSYVGELVRMGQLDPDAIFAHPMRSLITRVLGQLPDVEVDIFTVQLDPGDRLLLCSDGLWEMVHDPAEMVFHLRDADDPKDAAARLVEAANSYGGTDNIGVVVAQMMPMQE